MTIKSRTIVVATVLLYGLGGTRPSPAEQRFEGGLNALRSRQYEAAARHFQSVIDANPKDDQLRADGYFYLGLAWKRQADTMPKPATGISEVLRKSQHSFRTAATLSPKSANTWNNLGLVSASLGEFEMAEQAFHRAIDLGTADQVIFLLNCADLLRDNRRFDDALRLYQEAVVADPSNRHARQEIEAHFLKRDRGHLADFAWKLFGDGNIDWSREVSLQGLETAQDHDPIQISLLTCVVRSLASLQYKSDSIPDRERLVRLQENASFGEAIHELLLVHNVNAEVLVARNFRWWSKQVDVTSKLAPPATGWPQEAFTELIRSRGKLCEAQDNTDGARQYYQLAYELTPHYLDPIAIMRLADLWIKAGHRENLMEFLNEQEVRIFSEKGDAILKKNLYRTYEIHRALAMVYVAIDRWTGPNDPRGAEFQMRTAINDAAEFNALSNSMGSTQRIADWQLVDQLSQRYVQTERPEEAFTLKVNQSLVLRQAGKSAEASYLFKTLLEVEPPHKVSPDTMKTYQQLRTIWQANDFHSVPGTRLPLSTPNGAADLHLNSKSTIPDSTIRDVHELMEKIVNVPPTPSKKSTVSPVRLLPQGGSVDRIQFDGKKGVANVMINGKSVPLGFSIEPESGSAVESFRYVKP